MINGCIDGYSRYITYLKLHTNNKAATMLADFTDCLPDHGIPSHLRADDGTEFVHHQRFMSYVYAETRVNKSMFTGKSVHNQRIER